MIDLKRDGWPRAIAGWVWGLLFFLGLARLLKLGLSEVVTGSAVGSQVVLKGTLLLVSLAAWPLLGRRYTDTGWRTSGRWVRAGLPWLGLGAASMMAGSVASIFLGTRHPLASQMNFLQIVLVIWLLSSVSEEVFVRGLVQSWMEGSDGRDRIGSPTSPSVVSSALLFASMHISLMWSPIGVAGGLAIVLATLGLGYACAVLRARTGSLWPAIACHVLGNVAGIPGGILGVILYRVIMGRLPEMLTSG